MAGVAVCRASAMSPEADVGPKTAAKTALYQDLGRLLQDEIRTQHQKIRTYLPLGKGLGFRVSRILPCLQLASSCSHMPN